MHSLKRLRIHLFVALLALLSSLDAADSGLPVHYYVREGPAEIIGNTLHLTPVPPRAKFPVEVTVIAWQWGRSTDPKIRTAETVQQTYRVPAP